MVIVCIKKANQIREITELKRKVCPNQERKEENKVG